MIPLRIIAYPLTPIISDIFLPLDGVLLFFAMQQKYGRAVCTIPGKTVNDEWKTISLPLEKRGCGDAWYYACSSAQWISPVFGQSFWTKRVRAKECERLVDFNGRRGKVSISEGRYKSYQMPVYYTHALAVHWYAVGDADAISTLLEQCTHIGKKTAHGWGRVRWRIEEWHEDWSVWKEKTLMRPIPSDQGILYGIRPPYWIPENHVVAKLPHQTDL